MANEKQLELINKWDVVNRLICLENEYNFHKPTWDAQTLYRKLCNVEIEIGKAPTVDPVHAAGGCYCRECKHWEEVLAIYGKDMVCTNQGCMKVAKLPGDFCSKGEIREGG